MKTNKPMMFLNTKRMTTLLVVFLLATGLAAAQSNEKEGSNQFAMYTKNGDFKVLEEARKFSDNAYKERRDSSSYRSNLLRALVYSSLSVADSNRSLKYVKDPLEEAKFALAKLDDKQLNFENEAQLIYINRKIAHGYLILGKKALSKNEFQAAYDHYKQVDSFGRGDINVKRNLSVISAKLGKHEEAINFYKQHLDRSLSISAADYLILADLFKNAGKPNEQLNTLLNGRDAHPSDKNILFQIINIYAANGSYDAVVPLLTEAIRMEPENIELNYLAGYANEIIGNRNVAEQFYKKVINLDDNNYNGNYELGLLYLKDYIRDNSRTEYLELAERYLLKANEIDPNAVKALQSLAILFDKSGDRVQYERVRNQLNQNTFN